MSTAIVDVDLQKLPTEIVTGYSRAMVLFRFGRRPIGRAIIEAHHGIISRERLQEAGWNAGGELASRYWLEDFLGVNNSCLLFPTTPVTVAICTRERTDDLANCLRSLERLRHRPSEILVVDNAPKTQSTRELVTQFFPEVHYICEPAAGLDRARNRALADAANDLVAFIDDDAVADPDWLSGLLYNFRDPLVACVTGLTMPLELESAAQEWFEAHCSFCKGFERKVYKADEHDPLRTGQIGAGVNMAVRRSIIHELGGFDPALDAGTPTQSGGDHEMFSRLLANGYTIVYDPQALSWHKHRQTWNELRKALYGYGVGVYALLTRTLLVEREFAAIKIPWGWFRYDQLPKLMRALRRSPEVPPLELLIAELRGCAAGPFAYLKSRKFIAGGVA